MLDYKDIIIKRYALHMSGRQIAKELNVSKSGVNDFLNAFEKCEKLTFPLPEGITNYGIAELVYGSVPGGGGRDTRYELPDFAKVFQKMRNVKNMSLKYLWNRYVTRCKEEGKKFYQYSQFCELYNDWCEENHETLHMTAIPAQSMEVDFAGKTFRIVDRITGEIQTVVVFVAVLPYSQYIYAEGMLSTKEPQWIEVNNHALVYFGGVPALVICDNCRQAVIVNKDWIQPELNKDFEEWAEHNHTVILPAKVRKPRFKSSVERSVGILESGIFHVLEERQYFDIREFNEDLHNLLAELNERPFAKKEHNRVYYWLEEKMQLMSLPPTQYHYAERATARVSSDFHIRFDNAYYSVDKAYLHKSVVVRATASEVRIYSQTGEFLCKWPRAAYKGQWQTDPNHLPANYRSMAEWNGPYFIRKAMAVGPNTVEVINRILKSRKLEVQTYRQCMGVIGFTKKYTHKVLEECCRRALELDKASYTFIKNTIAAVAEESGKDAYNTTLNEERNRGAYVMGQRNMDVDTLLSRSLDLIQKDRKGDE